MRLNSVDLNLLVVFEAIYREENLTRAAEKLNLTQSALSHALGRLRDMVHDPLFARSGRRMVPTPFARTLMGPVREALATLEAGLFPNQAFDPGRPRRFVVGLRDVLETVWLPTLAVRLQQDAPLLEMVSTRVGRRDLETELVTGSLDLAIEIPLPVSSAIRHRQVAEDHLVVVARRGHPCLQGKKANLEGYLAQTHVLVSSRRRGPGLEDVVLEHGGHRRRVALRCQNYLAACQVVRATDLVLTMPERLARSLDLGPALVVGPFPLESPALAIHMYWHGAADNDPANAWLREQVERLVRAL
ncbi:MAG TPA: LysR family transcriptional regulator [Polyangiaceae bacterium]|nr:LysR family transcriptional regulator [Polyangiaceae bacterium]